MRNVYRGLGFAIAALVALQAAFIAYFISGLGKPGSRRGARSTQSVFSEGSTTEVGRRDRHHAARTDRHLLDPAACADHVDHLVLRQDPRWDEVGGHRVRGRGVAVRVGHPEPVGTSVPFLGALHGLNALILFGVAVTAAMRVRSRVAPVQAADDRAGPCRLTSVDEGVASGDGDGTRRRLKVCCRSSAPWRCSLRWSSCGRPAWCPSGSPCRRWAIPTTGWVRAPRARGQDTGTARPGRSAWTR